MYRISWGGSLLLALFCVASVSLPAELRAAEPTPGPPTHLTPVVPPQAYGPIAPIIEEDARTTIRTRFQSKLPELKRQLADSLRTHRVPATPRPTTDTARTLLVDPSLVLTTDVMTPDGRLLAQAGDHLNPLTTIPLLRTYLVLNAADPRQLAWAARELASVPGRLTTVLLTEGRFEQAASHFAPNTPVYPAPPDLFARFPIDSVPVRLSRAGDQLRIDIIPEADLE